MNDEEINSKHMLLDTPLYHLPPGINNFSVVF